MDGRMSQRTVMTLLALSLLLTVCMLKKSTLTPKASTIDLTIAVVGTAPVLTQSPNLHSIDLQEIKGDLRQYDAVMIMPEYLHKAAGRDYASVYRKAHIPFFFIGSQKSIEPFLNPSLSYEGSLNQLMRTQCDKKPLLHEQGLFVNVRFVRVLDAGTFGYHRRVRLC